MILLNLYIRRAIVPEAMFSKYACIQWIRGPTCGSYDEADNYGNLTQVKISSASYTNRGGEYPRWPAKQFDFHFIFILQVLRNVFAIQTTVNIAQQSHNYNKQ